MADTNLERLHELADRLIEVESDLEKIWSLSPDFVVVLDKANYIVRANPAWHTMLGWDIQEMIGEHFGRYIHPEDRDDVLEGIDQPNPITPVQGRFLALDGTYRWCDFRSINAEDRPRIYAIGRELTEDRIARAYLAAIFEHSLDAIVGKRMDGTITAWNKGAELLYGWTAEEAIGKNNSILLANGYNDFYEMMAAVSRGEIILNRRVCRKSKSGEILNLELSATPIEINGRLIGLSTFARKRHD